MTTAMHIGLAMRIARFTLCLALSIAPVSSEEKLDPAQAEEDISYPEKEDDAAAWKGWVDAFAKAEEIEFIVPQKLKGKKNHKVNDPKILKAMAIELAGSLEASEREEWEEEIEIRIKGFETKGKSVVWVSRSDESGPDGFSGHLFVIGYDGGSGSASVVIKRGTKVPVVSQVICEAGRSFGMRGFGEAEVKKPAK